MNRKSKRIYILGGVSLFAFTLATLLAIFGLAGTMAGVSETVIAETPDAILVSAGVADGKKVSLPVVYHDQKADECVSLYDDNLRDALHARQFEWNRCEYVERKVEQGMVGFELNEEFLPVAVGGQMISNRGVAGGGFARWFTEVEGKSKAYAGTLELEYREAGAEFSFYKKEFYPMDSVDFSNGDFTNDDGHNHLFTMDFAVPFTVLADGTESFEVRADDDTFVYVGDKLVLDAGGIHAPVTSRFVINGNGEIYSAVDKEDLAYSGVQVTKGDNLVIRIFHADRDSVESEFDVKFAGMNLTVESTQLASKNGGVQVAYDPMDPTYVAPLGVSKVFRPDKTKDYVVLATVEGVLIIVFPILVVLSVRFMMRTKK